VTFVNTNFANAQDRQLLGETVVIFRELRVRMRVRRGRERNSLLDCEPDDFIARVKFVHRFAPAGGGKFHRKFARSNELQCFIDDRSNVATGAMPMNFDQIQVGQTINETGRSDFANTAKIILVDFVYVSTNKLFRTVRHAVEHLIWIVEVMNRAENEIEFVPILLNPGSTGGGSLRIVIELDAGANLHIGIRGAKLVELIEVDSGVEAVVIGKRDVLQPPYPSAVDPRLQQFLRIRLNSMTLRVRVVIAEKLKADR